MLYTSVAAGFVSIDKTCTQIAFVATLAIPAVAAEYVTSTFTGISISKKTPLLDPAGARVLMTLDSRCKILYRFVTAMFGVPDAEAFSAPYRGSTEAPVVGAAPFGYLSTKTQTLIHVAVVDGPRQNNDRRSLLANMERPVRVDCVVPSAMPLSNTGVEKYCEITNGVVDDVILGACGAGV